MDLNRLKLHLVERNQATRCRLFHAAFGRLCVKAIDESFRQLHGLQLLLIRLPELVDSFDDFQCFVFFSS